MKPYQPSGKYSSRAFIYALIFNLTVTPVISYLLVLALQIKFGVITILIYAFFPFLFGALLSIICIRQGKVRNRAVAIALAIVSGIVSLYLQFNFWNGAYFKLPLFEILSHTLQPSVFFGDTSTHINGGWDLLAWCVQCVYLLGMLSFIADLQSRLPFSEAQEKWFDSLNLPPLSPVHDAAFIKAGLQSGNFHPRKYFKSVSKREAHTEITLYDLEGEDPYLTIVNYKIAYPRNYKALSKFDTETIVRYWHISRQLGEELKSLRESTNSERA